MTAIRERLRGLALPALALLLVVSGIWLSWDSSSRNATQRSGDDAMRTARESIVAMLSYQPDTAEKTLDEARAGLTGQFLDVYTQLIQTVVVPASKKDRISAVATVPAISVVSAHKDRAVLLAFVDQTLTQGAKPPALSASSIQLTMEKVDGRWLISSFDEI